MPGPIKTREEGSSEISYLGGGYVFRHPLGRNRRVQNSDEGQILPVELRWKLS